MRIQFSSCFKGKYKKLIAKQPNIRAVFETALVLLMKNSKEPSLKIHKLSGKLKDFWAFYLTYDLRVIFERKKDIIILINIGAHDEVY